AGSSPGTAATRPNATPSLRRSPTPNRGSSATAEARDDDRQHCPMPRRLSAGLVWPSVRRQGGPDMRPQRRPRRPRGSYPREGSTTMISLDTEALAAALAAHLQLDPATEWLDIESAAAHTGLSESWIRRNLETERIPYVRPDGRRLAFERAELDNWMRSRR